MISLDGLEGRRPIQSLLKYCKNYNEALLVLINAQFRLLVSSQFKVFIVHVSLLNWVLIYSERSDDFAETFEPGGRCIS